LSHLIIQPNHSLSEPLVIQANKSSADLVFAADLGGTHLRGALVDRCGVIHTQSKQQTPKGSSPECVVQALTDVANECQHRLGIETLYAASILVPGTLDSAYEIVTEAPNLPSLKHFGFKSALESMFRVPVLLENDANAAAVGEMWLGAARGARNVVCLTLGTGVGGGIILDGKLWRGSYGSAGELGHTSLDPFNGPQCKCGNRGCLEVYASATAIVRMTREMLSSYPDTILTGECLTAAKVYDAGKLGDRLALEIFKTVGAYLGVRIANLINTLGPEVVVIGGGVANGWSLFEDTMREEVLNRAFPSLATGVQIKPAELGDNAGLLGAAHLAWMSPQIERTNTD
jgi:glucokinase